MKFRSIYSLALLTITGALFVIGQSLRASDTDEAILTSAKNSYVFKNLLKDDAISAVSKDGTVTLTGTVAEATHKSLAGDTVANLPVDNQLTIKANPAVSDNTDWWLSLKVDAPFAHGTRPGSI